MSFQMTLIAFRFLLTEPTYKYTIPELVAELEARIANAVGSKAFETDILAAVVGFVHHLAELCAL